MIGLYIPKDFLLNPNICQISSVLWCPQDVIKRKQIQKKIILLNIEVWGNKIIKLKRVTIVRSTPILVL